MIPHSDRVPGRASGPSRSRVDDDGGLQNVSWKNVLALGFSRRREFIGERAMSEGPRGPHHLVARPGGGLRHPMVRPPPGPPPSLLWTPSSC
jgi:hypothetical protein